MSLDLTTDLFGRESTSIISGCGHYRYLICERWSDARVAGFVCHNPSTATHEKQDHTKSRLRNFAIAWQCGGYWIANRYAGGRSPHPGDLDAMADPIGPDNDRWLGMLAKNVDLIVVAWGDLYAPPEHTQRVIDILSATGKPLYCLGTNASGSPKHPATRGRSSIPAGQQPILWHPRMP
ncbi:MAG: DUF1643 domain-containing protein [Rhodanobacter sp.]|jgi:hypothetical protein